MECERFHNEMETYFSDYPENRDALPQNLKSHLDTCADCRKETELLCKGFAELKKDIYMEENASFWRDMKEDIRKEVAVPRRCFLSLSDFFSPWSIGWAAAAALIVCLFAVKWLPPNGSSLARQDIVYMFEDNPLVSTYEEAQLDNLPMQQDEPDIYIYSGLSDRWTSVMVEIFDNDSRHADRS